MPVTLDDAKVAQMKSYLGLPDLPDAEAFDTFFASQKALTEEAVGLSRQVEALTTERDEAVALSRTAAPATDLPPAILARLDEGVGHRLRAAVAESAIPKVLADRITKAIAGDGGVALSRTSDGVPTFDVETVVGWFDGLKLGGIDGGEVSPGQAVALARPTPGGEPPASAYDPAYVKSRAASVSDAA